MDSTPPLAADPSDHHGPAPLGVDTLNHQASSDTNDSQTQFAHSSNHGNHGGHTINDAAEHTAILQQAISDILANHPIVVTANRVWSAPAPSPEARDRAKAMLAGWILNLDRQLQFLTSEAVPAPAWWITDHWPASFMPEPETVLYARNLAASQLHGTLSTGFPTSQILLGHIPQSTANPSADTEAADNSSTASSDSEDTPVLEGVLAPAFAAYWALAPQTISPAATSASATSSGSNVLSYDLNTLSASGSNMLATTGGIQDYYEYIPVWNVSKRASEFVAQKVDVQPHSLSPSGLGPFGLFDSLALLEADDAKEIFKTACTGYCWVPDGAAVVLSGRGDLLAHLPQQPDSSKFHASSPCGHYLHPVYNGPVPAELKALAAFGVQLWANCPSTDGAINNQPGGSLSYSNGNDSLAGQGSSASAAGSEDTQSRQLTDSELQGSDIDESSNDQSGNQQSTSCDGSGEDSDDESDAGSSSSDLESLSSDSDSDSDNDAPGGAGGAGGASAAAQNASTNSTTHAASTAPDTQDQPDSPASPAPSTPSPHRRRQLLHRLPQANSGPFFPPRRPAGKKVLTRSSPLVAYPPVTPEGRHAEPSSPQQDNGWSSEAVNGDPDYMSHVLMSRRRRHARKNKHAAAPAPLLIKTDTTEDAPPALAPAPASQPGGSGLANQQMIETSFEGLLELQRARRIARSDSTLPPTLAPDFDEILEMYADMKKAGNTFGKSKPAAAAGSSAQSIFEPRNRVTDLSYSAVVEGASTATQIAVATKDATAAGATSIITPSAVTAQGSASNGSTTATAGTSTNGTGSSTHADAAASGSSGSGSFTASHVPRCECDLSRILGLPVADECSCWDIIGNDASDSKAE